MRIQAFYTYQKLFLRMATLLLLALLLAQGASAQQTSSPDTEFVAPKKKKKVLQKAEKQPPVKVNGALVKAVQTDQPWDIVSPFAPASYGNGEEMVSEDPDELGRPQGVILFGIEW